MSLPAVGMDMCDTPDENSNAANTWNPSPHTSMGWAAVTLLTSHVALNQLCSDT